MNILLVEDEANLRTTLQLNLELEGYTVSAFESGKSALLAFDKQPFNLVILDVMLPELSGYDICKIIREKNQQIPVLFLTAKANSDDKITGLKLGADDYIAKPFNLEELLLRIQNLLKRFNASKPITEATSYAFGKCNINYTTYDITCESGEQKQITHREIMLLKLLIEKENQVVSREEILDKVWGEEAYPSTRTIDNYIVAFRKYFEENVKDPQHFLSIRGVGYKFLK